MKFRRFELRAHKPFVKSIPRFPGHNNTSPLPPLPLIRPTWGRHRHGLSHYCLHEDVCIGELFCLITDPFVWRNNRENAQNSGGNPLGTSGFPSQRASNTFHVMKSLWRHCRNVPFLQSCLSTLSIITSIRMVVNRITKDDCTRRILSPPSRTFGLVNMLIVSFARYFSRRNPFNDAGTQSG